MCILQQKTSVFIIFYSKNSIWTKCKQNWQTDWQLRGNWQGRKWRKTSNPSAFVWTNHRVALRKDDFKLRKSFYKNISSRILLSLSFIYLVFWECVFVAPKNFLNAKCYVSTQKQHIFITLLMNRYGFWNDIVWLEILQPKPYQMKHVTNVLVSSWLALRYPFEMKIFAANWLSWALIWCVEV